MSRTVINPHQLDAGLAGRVAARLSHRGHRADLRELRVAGRTNDSIPFELEFAPQGGSPTREDLERYAQANYPGFGIDWQRTFPIKDTNRIAVTLVAVEDVIPVSGVKDIPQGFQSIGTGLYRRRVASKDRNVPDSHELWQMRKSEEGGLQLVRTEEAKFDPFGRPEELLKRKASKQKRPTANPYKGEVYFRVGMEVMTPDGVGTIRRISPQGSVVVAVNGARKPYSYRELRASWDPKEERDFFTQAYGDAGFASNFVQDFGRKDPR